MLVGMASETSKNYTYKCVDRSRHNGIKGAKARYDVHTNQILAHTFSHGTLDSVVSWAIHTLVCVVFAGLACHSYQHNILEMFLYLVHSLFWSLH